VIVATWGAARDRDDGLSEPDVREALQNLDPPWDALFSAEIFLPPASATRS